MLSSLRGVARPLFRAAAAPLVASGLSADAVTLLAVPLSAAAAVLVTVGYPGSALVAAVAAALMDALDGEVARLQGRATRFGSLLDATVDRIVEGVLLAGLAPSHPVPACLALLFSTLVSYVKARTGLEIPLDNQDWPGVGDRADRVMLLLLAYALHTRWPGLGCGLALWALTALSAVGAVQRLQTARQRIRAVSPE